MSCNNSIVTGQGAKFYIHDGSGWVAVANVIKITALDISKEFVEVTSLYSVDGYNEHRPSFKEAGELNISMFFDYTNLALFKDRFDSDIMHDYKIVFADANSTAFLFTAGVFKIPISVNKNDACLFVCLLKVGGGISLQ